MADAPPPYDMKPYEGQVAYAAPYAVSPQAYPAPPSPTAQGQPNMNNTISLSNNSVNDNNINVVVQSPVSPRIVGFQTGKWDHDIFECHKDPCNCLCVCCFYPCCSFTGSMASDIGHDYCLWCCCFGQNFCGTNLGNFMLRQEIKRVRGIPNQSFCNFGGEAADWAREYFCPMCAVCQLRHEIKLLNKEGYGGPQTMRMER